MFLANVCPHKASISLNVIKSEQSMKSIYENIRFIKFISADENYKNITPITCTYITNIAHNYQQNIKSHELSFSNVSILIANLLQYRMTLKIQILL